MILIRVLLKHSYQQEAPVQKKQEECVGACVWSIIPRASTRNRDNERIFLSWKQCTFPPESTPLHGHRITDRLQPHARTGWSMCVISGSRKRGTRCRSGAMLAKHSPLPGRPMASELPLVGQITRFRSGIRRQEQPC